MISKSILHMDLHKLNNKLVNAFVGTLLEHFWNIDKPWHTQIYKTYHGLDLRETTTFPLIILSMIGHGGCTQMSFFSGLPNWISKFLKLGLLALWKPITFCVNLWLRWGLKQSYSPCQELSNIYGMSLART